MNFINTYFAICLVIWAIDVLAFVAICAIAPLRKWCFRKFWKLSERMGSDMFEVIGEQFTDEDNEEESEEKSEE